MSVLKSPLFCVMAALMTVAAHAQPAAPVPLSSEDGQLILDALGTRVALPWPNWIDAPQSVETLLSEVSAKFGQEATQANLEIFPHGESEAFWTTLYGVRLSQQANAQLAQFRAAILNVYARGCKPETVAVFQLEPDQGDVIPPLGFVCGAYLDTLPGYAGKGEVMVMGFYKHENTVALVYQEWRGEAFDAADPESWPVAADLVEQRMAQFKSQARLLPAD